MLQMAAPLRLISAQQPANASEELTAAVLRYSFRYEGGNARLIQGRIPDDLTPNFYVPPGTKVLGSVVTGSGVVVLATTSAIPDSLRAQYTRALAPRGWKALESMHRGGFIDNPAHRPLVLCRDGAHLSVIHSPRASGSSDLYLLYRDAAGLCGEPRAERVEFVAIVDAQAQFPTLYAPPTAVAGARSRCYAMSSGSRSSNGTQTVIAADLSAEEVLRHYARQVESEGWRPASGPDRPAAAAMWTRTDSTGKAELVLQVREMGTPGTRCHQIEMRVSGARSR
jgi:hypothetical protein